MGCPEKKCFTGLSTEKLYSKEEGNLLHDHLEVMVRNKTVKM